MKKHLITFTPKCCQPPVNQDAEPAYEGTITLRMPTYYERMRMEANGPAKPARTGDESTDEHALNRYGVEMMGVYMAEVPAFVESIEITRKSDGFVFRSLDDVAVDSDIGSVTLEIVQKLRGKYAVGNAPSPS